MPRPSKTASFSYRTVLRHLIELLSEQLTDDENQHLRDGFDALISQPPGSDLTQADLNWLHSLTEASKEVTKKVLAEDPGHPKFKNLSERLCRADRDFQDRLKRGGGQIGTYEAWATCFGIPLADLEKAPEPFKVDHSECYAALNPAFTPAGYSRPARNELVQELQSFLIDDKTCVVEMVGAGGMGKTTTAYFFREQLKAGRYRCGRKTLPVYAEISLANQSTGTNLQRLEQSSAIALFHQMETQLRFAFCDDDEFATTLNKPMQESMRAHEFGKKLATHGGVLVIDGAEVLVANEFCDGADVSFVSFLRGLCQARPAAPLLIILTTRWSLQRLWTGDEFHVWETRNLNRLDSAIAVELLEEFRIGAKGIPRSEQCTSEQYKKALVKFANEVCFSMPIFLNLYAGALVNAGIPVDQLGNLNINLSDPKHLASTTVASTGSPTAPDMRDVVRSMIGRYRVFFETRLVADARVKEDGLALMGQLSTFWETSIKTDVVEKTFWPDEPKRFDDARRLLSQLKLIEECALDATTLRCTVIVMHPELKQYFYEFQDVETKRLNHLKLLKRGEKVLRSQAILSFSDAQVHYNSARHAILGRSIKTAWEILSSPNLIEACVTIPGVHAARCAALTMLFEAVDNASPEEILSDDQRRELFLEVGSYRTITHGMADATAGQAYSLAVEHSQDHLSEKFVGMTGVWRSTLVRGRLREIQQLKKQLDDVVRQIMDKDIHAYGLVTLQAIGNGHLFRGSDYRKIASYDFEAQRNEQPLDQRERMLERLNVVYDPLLSQLLFKSWALALLGEPTSVETAESAFPVAESCQTFDRGAGWLLASYFNIALGYFLDDPARVLKWASVLHERTRGLREVFLTHGGAFLHAWADSKEEPTRRLERMRQSLFDWRATGAELLTPFFSTILAEAMLDEHLKRPDSSLLKSARCLIKDAREASVQREELWWYPDTLRVAARIANCGGKPPGQVQRLLRRARDLAEKQESQLLLNRLDRVLTA